MIQSNFDKWQLYMRDFTSPQNYIDWGWLYLISASLQRRVWIGPDHSKLFPNIYTILVGDPGVGKGLVIKQVAEILKYHKLQDPSSKAPPKNKELSQVDRELMEETAKADYEAAQKEEGSIEHSKEKRDKSYEKPLLIPVAADATTYEALVRAMSRAIRRINYTTYDETTKRDTLSIYTHSSLCFCLEEISSLFRKRTEDLVHFLIQAYDCGDYTYDTKTQGKDRVRKCCLNFFGGTTPSFMQTTFDDQLLTEGFSSRTFFIFASQNRKTALWIPDLSPEQKQAYTHILRHVESLTKLYGKVSIEPSTAAWLEEWWKGAQNERPNTNLKLNPYYARKNIHVLKIAMALHFGESTEMSIKQQTFEKALKLLAEEEKRMHYALGLSTNNPLATPARKILQSIEVSGKRTKKQLLGEFWGDLPKGLSDLEEILEYLKANGKLKTVDGPTDKLGNTPIMYDVVRKQEMVTL